MKRYLRDYIDLLLPAILLIALDQWTKFIVTSNLSHGEMWSPWPWLQPYARIVNWSNTGAAFGLFKNLGGFFTVLAFFVALFILYYFPRINRSDWLIRVALTLQFAGALGNLIDRLRQGFVTDFISIGDFAVFNVADSCISVGSAVLILAMYRQELKEKQQKTPKDEMQAGESDAVDRLIQDGQGE